MQLKGLIAAGLVLLATQPATALCSIALDTGGTLGLSGDGTVLGSDTGGIPGVVLITSTVTANTIDVSAPARVSAPPAGYDAGSETVEAAYAGAGLLAGVNQAYTDQATSFNIGPLGVAVALTLHNRIVNPSGFAAGTYTTQTVITCR